MCAQNTLSLYNNAMMMLMIIETVIPHEDQEDAKNRAYQRDSFLAQRHTAQPCISILLWWGWLCSFLSDCSSLSHRENKRVAQPAPHQKTSVEFTSTTIKNNNKMQSSFSRRWSCLLLLTSCSVSLLTMMIIIMRDGHHPTHKTFYLRRNRKYCMHNNMDFLK